MFRNPPIRNQYCWTELGNSESGDGRHTARSMFLSISSLANLMKYILKRLVQKLEGHCKYLIQTQGRAFATESTHKFSNATSKAIWPVILGLRVIDVYSYKLSPAAQASATGSVNVFPSSNVGMTQKFLSKEKQDALVSTSDSSKISSHIL